MKVDNELRDVAHGSIVNPRHRTLHTVEMGPGDFRVTLARVYPGCEHLYPPYQPPGADEEMKLGECVNWPLKWPKSLIRLDPVVRSRTVTPVCSAPNEALTAPEVEADERPEPSQFEPSSSAFVSDDCLADLDFLSKDGGFDVRSSSIPSSPREKENPTKKRLFASQGTPEDAGLPEPKRARDTIISPGTLKAAATAALGGADPIPGPKKGRKRNKKPKPEVLPDVVPEMNWHENHVLGKPILPKHLSEKLRGDMRSLHDGIWHVEQCLLESPNPGYPLFVGKVPKGFGFVDSAPADIMFLRFEDIFKMYHQKRLHQSLVRLVALRMAFDLSKTKNRQVAIMDPYYMQEWIVRNEPGTVSRYVEEFLVANKDKKAVLVPYFAE
jgi:hypothetical protein